jgi:hypothetical protein
VKQRPAYAKSSSSNRAKNLFQRNHHGCESSDLVTSCPTNLSFTPFDPGYLSTPEASQFEFFPHLPYDDFNPVKFDLSWSSSPAYTTTFNPLPIEEPSHIFSQPNDLSGLGHSKDNITRGLHSQLIPYTIPEHQALTYSPQGVYQTALSGPF